LLVITLYFVLLFWDAFRKCLAAGVHVQCKILAGTIHGIGSYLAGLCPEITVDQTQSIAEFASSTKPPSKVEQCAHEEADANVETRKPTPRL
jgi:hypothetical protein